MQNSTEDKATCSAVGFQSIHYTMWAQYWP